MTTTNIPPSTNAGASDTPTPSQRRALGILALLSVAALVWLSLPVASGLFLGTFLAFSLLGVYERLVTHLKSRGLAAVLLSVGSGLVLVGAVGVLLYFVIDRGLTAANDLAHGFQPEGPLTKSLARFEAAASSSPLGPIDVTARVRELAATTASKLSGWAGAIANATFGAVLVVFFTIMTCFFVLRRWVDDIVHAESLLPLHPRHTRAVLTEFQSVGKKVFVGTLLTGLAQGVLAGIGYAIAGLPEPALLGALTAIASLVPAVGTLLIWLPAGIVLIASGHPVAGVFVLAWGVLVVVVVMEYVVRPKFLGRGQRIPSLLTFISLFGGVAVFGLLGLVLGPVIVSVAYALLRTYDKEMAELRR
jgi:predicted PurR-regulated permease PerM